VSLLLKRGGKKNRGEQSCAFSKGKGEGNTLGAGLGDSFFLKSQHHCQKGITKEMQQKLMGLREEKKQMNDVNPRKGSFKGRGQNIGYYLKRVGGGRKVSCVV